MINKPLYGPDNPHPLSQMKAELVWDGKYDEFGNRREVDIAGAAMPLQKIETIDEPRSAHAAYSGEIGHPFRFNSATHRSVATPEF